MAWHHELPSHPQTQCWSLRWMILFWQGFSMHMYVLWQTFQIPGSYIEIWTSLSLQMPWHHAVPSHLQTHFFDDPPGWYYFVKVLVSMCTLINISSSCLIHVQLDVTVPVDGLALCGTKPSADTFFDDPPGWYYFVKVLVCTCTLTNISNSWFIHWNLNFTVPADALAPCGAKPSADTFFDDPLGWYHFVKVLVCISTLTNISNSWFIHWNLNFTVPADALAPCGAKPSADTSFWWPIWMILFCKGLVCTCKHFKFLFTIGLHCACGWLGTTWCQAIHGPNADHLAGYSSVRLLCTTAYGDK